MTKCFVSAWACQIRKLFFHDFDFVVCQAVEVIDQRVNLAVEGIAFVAVEIFVFVRLRGGELLFGSARLVPPRPHFVVTQFVGGMGKINRTKWKLRKELPIRRHPTATKRRADKGKIPAQQT